MKNTTENQLAKSMNSKRYTSYIADEDVQDTKMRNKVKFADDYTFQGKYTTDQKDTDRERISTKHKKMICGPGVKSKKKVQGSAIPVKPKKKMRRRKYKKNRREFLKDEIVKIKEDISIDPISDLKFDNPFSNPANFQSKEEQEEAKTASNLGLSEVDSKKSPIPDAFSSLKKRIPEETKIESKKQSKKGRKNRSKSPRKKSQRKKSPRKKSPKKKFKDPAIEKIKNEKPDTLSDTSNYDLNSLI